jgi:hypothetical protein
MRMDLPCFDTADRRAAFGDPLEQKYSYVTVDEMPIRKRTYDAYLGRDDANCRSNEPGRASTNISF